jgi:FtsH-binding integral membrane protein
VPLQGAGLIAVLVAAVAGIAAIVVRLIRSRGIQRRQMWWFVVLITPVIAMIAIDTDGVIPGALSAVIVFTLILGAIGYPLLGRPASSPDLS